MRFSPACFIIRVQEHLRPLHYTSFSQNSVNKLQTNFRHQAARSDISGIPSILGLFLKEVTVIRQMAPINLIVYYPKTEEGKEELAKRVSDVHAAAVTQRLKSLNCPTQQKLDLLDAVIDTVKERSREQA